ncbi:Polysaccharide deacetylase [Aphelenchoides besseyi]|nr:Polysaccharide deacetylase [Aphelenchoides besseyi]
MSATNETSLLLVIGEPTEEQCELSATINRSPYMMAVTFTHALVSICGLIALHEYYNTKAIRKAAGLVSTNLKVIGTIAFMYYTISFVTAFLVYFFRMIVYVYNPLPCQYVMRGILCYVLYSQHSSACTMAYSSIHVALLLERVYSTFFDTVRGRAPVFGVIIGLFLLGFPQYWIFGFWLPFYVANNQINDRVYCSGIVHTTPAVSQVAFRSISVLLTIDLLVTISDFAFLLYNKKQISRYYKQLHVSQIIFIIRSSNLEQINFSILSWSQRCPLPEHPERCQLPDCFCSRNGREPVPGIPLEKIPQIVVLTFDDPINDKSMRDYRHIFNDFQLLNPNGCPIRGTFFVSHEWTNYNEVQWIAEQGHELASNSISHRLLSGANWTEWLAEMDGQRRVMAKFANVVDSEIVGMRAPQLGLGGDVQFLMAKSSSFIYDNTIGADPDVNGAPFWPHTLDFAVPYKCENDFCPGVSIPGFWVIPNNVYHGSTEFLRSPMLQGILIGNETADHVLYYLFRNFNRAYSQNRAPYVMNLNAEFLQSHGGIGMRALKNFLGLMRQYRDVYFMTLRELIEWMKKPQSVDQLAQRSGCQAQTHATSSRVCTQPNKCIYQTPTLGSKEHQFLSCNTCPMIYPWTGNPTGAF